MSQTAQESALAIRRAAGTRHRTWRSDRVAWAFAVALLATVHVGAQQPPPGTEPPAPADVQQPAQDLPPPPNRIQEPAGPVFSARTDLVVLHVTVIDHRTGVLGKLSQDAFAVYEDGVRQTISQFSNEDMPITVGLIIDNSTSMMTRREMIVNAGLAFADSSRPDDQLFTINFNERIWHGLPPVARFTSSRALLHMALRTVKAEGRTALFDGVTAGLDHMQSAPLDRKILVVLSDGGDNASATRFDALLARARRSDVVIYSVGLIDQYDRDAKPGVLKQLAKETGGDAIFPDRESDVVKAFESIAREVRRGYTVGYVPTNSAHNGTYRHVRVRVRVPGRDLTVRVREGYLAPADPAAP